MHRDELGDLAMFLAVAEERSFTRAAAKLGTSQSLLSQTVRRLEARLGLKLLTRTTRSVATTQAGQQLADTLRPAFDDIDARIDALGILRDKPAGTIRITTSRHAAETILWPAIARLLPDYPDIQVELSINSALTDIVTERFDAGVRLGEQVARDMVSVPIGPELRMVVVGAPSYFTDRPAPATPHDLMAHSCINLRMRTSGALYAWEFGKDGRELNVRVAGPLVFDESPMILRAAVEGFGLACLLEDQVAGAIARGDLVQVLDDWSPPFAGYHLYYPDRRQLSPAFALFVEALRYRDPGSPGNRDVSHSHSENIATAPRIGAHDIGEA